MNVVTIHKPRAEITLGGVRPQTLLVRRASITIAAAGPQGPAGPGGGGGAAIQGSGTYVQSTGTVQFANSNGVTFGLTNGTMTASVQTGGGAQTGISTIAGGGTTITQGGVTLAGSGNVLITNNAGSIVISGSTQSVQTQGSCQVNGSTGAVSLAAGSSLSSSQNGSTVTFGLASNITTALQSAGAYLTTAMQSNAGTGFMSTSERNNYFATAGNTFANSTHSHGNPTLNLTNLSGTTGSNSNGLTISLSAGNYLTTAMQSNAGTGFMSTSERNNYFATAGNTFANSTHSHGNPTLNLTNISGTTASNSNGLTISLSAGNYLTTAMQSNAGTGFMSTSERNNYFATAGNTFANSTHSHGAPTLNLTNISGTTASASNGFTLSLSAAAGGGGADGYNIIAAAGSTANTTGTIVFSNSNGVSFGLNGATVTAAHNALTTAMASNAGSNFLSTSQSSLLQHTSATSAITANAFPSAQTTKFAGTGTSATNVSVTLNSNGLAISVAPVGGGGDGVNIIAAGGSTANTTGTIVFSNSNGVSFGLNGATLTASVAAGGAGGVPDRRFKEIIQGERLTTIVGLSATNVSRRVLLQPFWLEGTGIQVKTARVIMSFGASSNRSLAGTFHFGLYSQVNDTLITQVASDSWSVSSTASASSASWNGIAYVDFTNMSDFACTAEGRYVAAFMVNPVSANVTWMPATLYGADPTPTPARIWSGGGTVSVNATYQMVPFFGAYMTTTTALPPSIALSNVNGVSSQSMFEYYGIIKEI